MNPTVLLIEDNAQNRYLVTFLLEHHGYSVISASDGPSAVAKAQNESIDLILLDIQLPFVDGYTVANVLRSISRFGDTPIVAITSYAMPGDREKCLAAGCSGYIEKPIDPKTFVQQIEQFVKPSSKPESM